MPAHKRSRADCGAWRVLGDMTAASAEWEPMMRTTVRGREAVDEAGPMATWAREAAAAVTVRVGWRGKVGPVRAEPSERRTGTYTSIPWVADPEALGAAEAAASSSPGCVTEPPGAEAGAGAARSGSVHPTRPSRLRPPACSRPTAETVDWEPMRAVVRITGAGAEGAEGAPSGSRPRLSTTEDRSSPAVAAACAATPPPVGVEAMGAGDASASMPLYCAWQGSPATTQPSWPRPTPPRASWVRMMPTTTA